MNANKESAFLVSSHHVMRWNEIQGNSNTFKENAFLVSPSLRTLTNNKKKAVSQSKEIQLSQIKLSLILAGFSEEKN